MYLNTFGTKMQNKHHPHNLNMLNTRALALLPNPSDTEVATLIGRSYHDTFLHFFKTMFLCIALAVLELYWNNRLSTDSEFQPPASPPVLELMACTNNSIKFSNFF